MDIMMNPICIDLFLSQSDCNLSKIELKIARPIIRLIF